MSNFYHPSPISTLYPGSSYAAEFWVTIDSGPGEFSFQILNSVNSIIFTNSFTGELGRWVSFLFVFSVQSVISNPIMRFEYTGETVGLSHFDNIFIRDNKDMLALGVVQIYPEWNMRRQTIQNRSDHRTKGGKLYSYTWGDYEQFNIPLEYVQNSKAAIINSWWSEDALIHFKIYSGGQWQVNCCHLMNDTAPFDERPKPYDQYRSGVLELETF